MKKAIVIILTLCILGAAGYFGWQAYQKYVAQPADSGSATLVTPYTVTRGNLSKTVTGTGTLSISQTENVSLDYGVTVTETLVEEGDTVTSIPPPCRRPSTPFRTSSTPPSANWRP